MTQLIMPPRWAGKYLGMQYAERGDSRDGVDCFGLSQMVLYQEKGVHLELRHLYAQAPKEYENNIKGQKGRAPFTRIYHEIGEEQPFDLVLMKAVIDFNGKSYLAAGHMGVCTAPGWLLHVVEGKLSEQVRFSTLANRIVFFARHDDL